MTRDDPSWLAGPTPGEALIQSLFLEGAERDAEGRAAVLARATDDAVRARLCELFAAHDALPPEAERVPVEEPDPERLIGRVFGDFTVRSFLASGGTADVYIARQGSPARDVVLKVRRARYGSEGQVRRFLAEAERLADFSHPGIAHIYGSGVAAGESQAQVAWIAMERIDGLALAEWRTLPEATVAARVALVARVAETVAAAHARGIVHRDLAPANIRIDRDDAPRLIDFGIARTMHALDAHPTIDGTPGFASPEQVRGEVADPRDDVYALGKLLAWLVPEARGGIARAIRAATAELRAARPDARAWAAQLAAEAVPRGRVLVAAAVAALLVAAASGTVLLRGGSDRFVGPEQAALSARAVEQVMNAVLDGVSAAKGGSPPAKLLDDLARAQAMVLAETNAPARVRWRALERMGTVWRDLGEGSRAVEAGRAAAAIADGDPEAPPLIGARLRAWVAVRLAFGDDREAALAATRDSLTELARSSVAREDGAVAPPEGQRRDAHQNYGQSHVYLALAAKLCGELDLAEQATVIAGPFHRTGVFAGTASQVTYLINAARLAIAREDLDRAAALADEAVKASDTVEADDPEARLATLGLQAGILEQAGRYAESAAIYRRQIETWTELGGPNDPRTITALNNLGLNLLRQGDSAAAIPLLEDACARALRVHGERHQHTLDNHGNLLLALDAAGRTDDAVAICERFLPIVEAARGRPSVDLCDWMLALGGMRAKQGRTDEARALLERVIADAQGLAGASATLREARAKLDSLDRGG